MSEKTWSSRVSFFWICSPALSMHLMISSAFLDNISKFSQSALQFFNSSLAAAIAKIANL